MLLHLQCMDIISEQFMAFGIRKSSIKLKTGKMKNIKYSTHKIDFISELRNSVNNYFKKNNIQPYGNKEIYLKMEELNVFHYLIWGQI